MQTELHIAALVRELNQLVVGGTVVSTEFYKKERAAYLFIKRDKKTYAFGFVYHPTGYGTFVVPASKIRLDTREKPWPIFALDGAELTQAEQVGFDRMIRLTFKQNDAVKKVIVEAIGPNGNMWFVDEDDTIEATLRKRSYDKGEKYKPPAAPDKLNPFDITTEQLRSAFSEFDQVRYALKKQILGINDSLAVELVTRSDVAGLDDVDIEDLDDSGYESLTKSCRNLAQLFTAGDNGYLYSLGGAQVYPFKLSSFDIEPEKFKSLSLAVLAMVSRRQTVSEQVDEKKQTVSAVERAVKKLKRRIENIESDLATAADFEKYKQLGELLQINHHLLKRGMQSITVENVYDETEMEIELDPALAPEENVEQYFRRYRKGREGLEKLERRLEISRGEIAQVQEILDALESNFDDASKRFSSDIASLLPKVGERRDTAPRLPYREHTLSTGVTIYIGRDGADNDRTTFEFARPYELWFHAQQCAGSHVVMKFPNKSFEPTKQEIEETAAIAAWHSKARNDSLVPVIYAERRYVRKPRKAKPGLVTVEREKSVMVVPAPATS